MDAIPPVPIINTFDTWLLIDITLQRQAMRNRVGISGFTENVDMFIE